MLPEHALKNLPKHNVNRPRSKEEFEDLEASGQLRASRFVKAYARENTPVDLGVAYKIHEKIFQEAWEDIAGKNRFENVRPRKTGHMPPHHQKVPLYMREFGISLRQKIAQLPKRRIVLGGKNELKETRAVIATTAWAQHRITWIHPFREGNGRTARLFTNLILERYGFPQISIKINQKKRYLNALRQADKHTDYTELERMIKEALSSRYKEILKANTSSKKGGKKKRRNLK